MKALAAALLGRPGLRPLAERAFRWSGVLVLNYHRVGDGSGSMFDRGLWSARADAFADQVRFCRSHYDIITPDDLPWVLGRGRGRYILLTFDDGYRDNYEVAFPILRGEGAPATFFVTTGFIDSRRLPWWDEIAWMVRTSAHDAIALRPWRSELVRFDDPARETAVRTLLRTYKTLPAAETEAFLCAIGDATGSGRYDARTPTGRTDWWMTWDMLREMKAAGMTIGGHTVTHPVLARAARDVQRREILECGRRLAEELGEPMRYFSYPVGGSGTFDGHTRACLEEAGVRYAFSYYAGYRRFENWDDYDIRRVPIESYVAPAWFRSILVCPQLFARS